MLECKCVTALAKIYATQIVTSRCFPIAGFMALEDFQTSGVILLGLCVFLDRVVDHGQVEHDIGNEHVIVPQDGDRDGKRFFHHLQAF